MATHMIPPAYAPDFLAAHGWRDATILPLAGDASFRRYFRVIHGDRRAVLMDAPPPHEDPRPFLSVADYLSGHGFRAPAVHGRDLDRGLVLLEDFGDRLMRAHLDQHPQDEAAIYRQAIDELVRLADCPPASVPRYGEEAYLREVRLFTEWYCPAAGLSVDSDSYDAVWLKMLQPLLDCTRPVTVLRDYHAENIMLLDDGRLGLLDFQDALVGHAAYDLVSLLQDARRDVAPALEQDMLTYYRAATGSGADFDFLYHLLGAQRNAKIIGIFTRLWQRDGKPRYLDFLPRMWGLLERDLSYPGMEPVARWFADNVPHDVRRSKLGMGENR